MTHDTSQPDGCRTQTALLTLAVVIGAPLVEIAIMIEAGSLFGLTATLAAIVLTAVIGTALVRSQGLATLFRFRSRVADGDLPLEEMAVGLCIVVAGILLLAPGFVTDAIGFVLLVPASRRLIVAEILRRAVVRRADGTVIDGDFREVGVPELDRRDGKN